LSVRGTRFAEAKLTDANGETVERLEEAEAGLNVLGDEAARRIRLEEDLRQLCQEVEALDGRFRGDAATMDEPLLKLVKALDDVESAE
jgi:hypothetical protein